MSVYSQIVRITGLRDRIATKLVNLGLIARQAQVTPDLDTCTEAIEDIDEVTPYLISTSGIKNVAAYKYAQIDETAWVPAGSTPSGLESHLTGLGATGILSSRPRNPISIGTVYPNTGSQGMYANALEIDGDVIKPENIKYGVQILGVTGDYYGVNGIESEAYGIPSDNNTKLNINIGNCTNINNILSLYIVVRSSDFLVLDTNITSLFYRPAASSSNTLHFICLLRDASANIAFDLPFTINIGSDYNTLVLTAPSGYSFINDSYPYVACYNYIPN